ncbi:3'-5' exoribonuclease [Salmonella enterica]
MSELLFEINEKEYTPPQAVIGALLRYTHHRRQGWLFDIGGPAFIIALQDAIALKKSSGIYNAELAYKLSASLACASYKELLTGISAYGQVGSTVYTRALEYLEEIVRRLKVDPYNTRKEIIQVMVYDARVGQEIIAEHNPYLLIRTFFWIDASLDNRYGPCRLAIDVDECQFKQWMEDCGIDLHGMTVPDFFEDYFSLTGLDNAVLELKPADTDLDATELEAESDTSNHSFEPLAVEKPAFCLDVENLSLEKNGVLLEIGIVFFDLANPESIVNGPRIDVFPDVHGQIADGGRISESTVEWWQTKAPKEARDYCFQHGKVMDYKEAIAEVNAFVNNIRDKMTEYYGKDTFYYLARGETDWPQLEYWFRKAGFKPICRYNQVQDIRSMIAAYQDKPVSIMGTKEYPDVGIPLIRHTAIGDAIMDAYDVALARSMTKPK